MCSHISTPPLTPHDYRNLCRTPELQHVWSWMITHVKHRARATHIKQMVRVCDPEEASESMEHACTCDKWHMRGQPMYVMHASANLSMYIFVSPLSARSITRTHRHPPHTTTDARITHHRTHDRSADADAGDRGGKSEAGTSARGGEEEGAASAMSAWHMLQFTMCSVVPFCAHKLTYMLHPRVFIYLPPLPCSTLNTLVTRSSLMHTQHTSPHTPTCSRHTVHACNDNMMYMMQTQHNSMWCNRRSCLERMVRGMRCSVCCCICTYVCLYVCTHVMTCTCVCH